MLVETVEVVDDAGVVVEAVVVDVAAVGEAAASTGLVDTNSTVGGENSVYRLTGGVPMSTR